MRPVRQRVRVRDAGRSDGVLVREIAADHSGRRGRGLLLPALPRRSIPSGERPGLKNVTREILASGKFLEPRVHVGRVDDNRAAWLAAGVERYLLEQLLHHGI